MILRISGLLVSIFLNLSVQAESLMCRSFLEKNPFSITHLDPANPSAGYTFMGDVVFSPAAREIRRDAQTHRMGELQGLALDFIIRGKNHTVLADDLIAFLRGKGFTANVAAAYKAINKALTPIFGFDLIGVANGRYFIDRAGFEADPRQVITVEHKHRGKTIQTSTLKSDWSYHVFGDVFYNPTLGLIRKGSSAAPLAENFATLLVAVLEAPGRRASRGFLIKRFGRSVSNPLLETYKVRLNEIMRELIGFNLITSSVSRYYYLNYAGIIPARLYVPAEKIMAGQASHVIEITKNIFYNPQEGVLRHWKVVGELTDRENFLVATFVASPNQFFNRFILSRVLASQGIKPRSVATLIRGINEKLEPLVKGNFIEFDGAYFYLNRKFLIVEEAIVVSRERTIGRAIDSKWSITLEDRLKLSPSSLEVTNGVDVVQFSLRQYEIFEELSLADQNRVSMSEISALTGLEHENFIRNEIRTINIGLSRLTEGEVSIQSTSLAGGIILFYLVGIYRPVLKFRDMILVPSIPYLVVFDPRVGRYVPLFKENTSPLALRALEHVESAGRNGLALTTLLSRIEGEPYVVMGRKRSLKFALAAQIEQLNEAYGLALGIELENPKVLTIENKQVRFQ